MDMTIGQFRAWAAGAHFTVEDHIDGVGEIDYEIAFDEESHRPTLGSKAFAWVWREAKATLPDGSPFAATHQVCVEWIGTARERYDADYDTYEAPEVFPSEIDHGVRLIDEDGEPLDQGAVSDAVSDILGEDHPVIDITNIDIEALIPALAITDIDTDTENDMKTITLRNDNAPDVRFTGELMAEVASNPNNASGYYSGHTGRWTELELYRTAGGRFVGRSVGRTQWQGEHDRHKVEVCDDVAGVVKFFGHGWLAKDLYEAAGIDAAQDVD